MHIAPASFSCRYVCLSLVRFPTLELCGLFNKVLSDSVLSNLSVFVARFDVGLSSTSSNSNQTCGLAELKHINKRRKRN
jgi:hypothetical protein